ncbi:sine oculis-binding protein homolog isoform X2 [Pectinophora gossypiella]|uniref:sine oculis-binding protein homolog isoform X2 n=1 Tax=Pectinophora gossypiella TaxID=13191 RepID=UPI00214E83A0|nr:sine oculis-binding protein homolog isoform X2 [Pectinophora gossypiella]
MITTHRHSCRANVDGTPRATTFPREPNVYANEVTLLPEKLLRTIQKIYVYSPWTQWTLNIVMGSKSPTDSTSPKAQVKKENEEEIKEFAETAMNELLGWYGYERLELRRWAASRACDGSPEPNAENKTKDECSWCNKRTREGGAIAHAGSTFCSELCFSQSRRANFKRAKTCDWCRHVRHTVAYVDFQDGATQLQFCSDKCLNQYKMHIFCRETQAHLDLNPHLVNAASTSNLITPDLWLKNCKSRSASPTSDKSASSNPENPKSTEKSEPPKTQRKSPLPLITIAPTAKLMKPKPTEEKPQKEKKETRNKMNLRKRRTSKCSATVTSQTMRQNASTPKAHDLRLCSPSDGSSPASTAGNSTIHSPPHSNPIPPPFSNPIFGMPPPTFMENGPERHSMPNMFPPRHFMPRPGMVPERPRLPPPMSFPHAMGQTPPVTVLVPYPVVIPIPFPIPIPMPITSFIQAHCLNKVKNEVKTDDSEGPLDFTMNADKNKAENTNIAVTPEATEESSYPEQNDVNERLEDDRCEGEGTETGNPEQTLPKFKITRLGNKMAKIVPKPREPSESTRPLRKRRRLVEVTSEDDPLIPKTRKIVEV